MHHYTKWLIHEVKSRFDYSDACQMRENDDQKTYCAYTVENRPNERVTYRIHN